jgi:putative transposase
VRDLLRNAGFSTWKEYHEKYLKATYKRDERLRHLYITTIRFLADELYSKGVRKLYIGYPIMLSQNNGNKYNTNIWWYRKIVLWIVDIFREYGIKVEIVPEDYTGRETRYAETNIKTEEYIEGYMNARRLGRRSMQILMQH